MADELCFPPPRPFDFVPKCEACDDTGWLTEECGPCRGGGFTGYGRGYGDVCDDCGGQRRQVIDRCPQCAPRKRWKPSSFLTTLWTRIRVW